MAEADSIPQSHNASNEVTDAVSRRMAHWYHNFAAMHALCEERLSNISADNECEAVLVAMCEMLRSAARDAQACSEALRPDFPRMGFFEGRFGAI